jgi:hypothetical protein
MSRRILAATLSATLCATAVAEPGNMLPGLWQITTEVEMPGMPMKLPPQTIQHCYTAADLARQQNTIPQATDSNCSVTDYRLEGNTATWNITCRGDTPMQGSGTMTTTATSYSGSMQSTMQGPGGSMQMTNHWHAQRIGDCP